MPQRLLVLLAVVALVGCGPAHSTTDAGAETPLDAGDPYQAVFDAVTSAGLQARLREVTGVDPVTVGGATFTLTDRWSAPSKTHFRAYFRQYFEALGATVNELPFTATNLVQGDKQGHNIEAVLPGASPDSLVIIVHYDTVGISGKEALNPGADDDGSGLSMLLEAGRIFAAQPHRKNTVRFVAADYEEISDNLDGDFAYVNELLAKAHAEQFHIIAASDNDQTGWSCWDENPALCTKLAGGLTYPANSTFKLITCSGNSKAYDFPALREGFMEVADTYQLAVTPFPVCDGSGDTDHYPFWVAGIPAYVIEEWGAENNPHYDDTGGDTLSRINFDLLTNIAKVQITFQAKLVGLDAP
jgi:hypothetical protein